MYKMKANPETAEDEKNKNITHTSLYNLTCDADMCI